MTKRNAALQAVLDCLIEGLQAQRAALPPTGKATLTRVVSALASNGAASGVVPARHRPAAVDANLLPALAEAKATGGHAAAVAVAVEALLPQITWYTRDGLASKSPDFAERHALATLIGSSDRPGVLEVRDDVTVGVSLLAPETEYPDHRHPPEELYLALTLGDWRQELGAWFEPGPGGIVYNTSNILHGMRAGKAPQLALWCLPR